MIDKSSIYKDLNEAAFLDKVASYRGDSLKMDSERIQDRREKEVSTEHFDGSIFAEKWAQRRISKRAKSVISYSVAISVILVWLSLFIYPIAAILVSLVSIPAIFLDSRDNWRYGSYLIMMLGGLFTSAALIRLFLI
jgi:hypothetical protein